ncbi:peroxidase 7-like [Chenopodium quinoa]|nr:peroxidase 7-like [Chenopodium quinoa]
MNSHSFFSAFFVIISLGLISSVCCQDLNRDYYDYSCNDFEEIIAKKVWEWYKKDETIAASLIRLHFHDCSVRGCDASILLDYPGSERRANASKTLRGFEVIDDIKATLEKKCPKVVSCADILTAAARDATLLVKGPFWSNEYGRKDGRISIAQEAEQLPKGREDVTSLIEFYQSKGLSLLDLVVLSGAHTIGRSSCVAIQKRLANCNKDGKHPIMAPRYLNYLRRKCKNGTEYVNLDAKTPSTFDNQYYKNIESNMGLLYTDQVLYTDHRTSEYIGTLAKDDDRSFPYLFSSSMVKLGSILGEAQDDGEVRLHCSRVNSGY